MSALKPMLPIATLPSAPGRILVRLKSEPEHLQSLPVAFQSIAGAFLLVDTINDRRDRLVLTGAPDTVFDDMSVFAGWMPLDTATIHEARAAASASLSQHPVFKSCRRQLDA